MPTIPIAKHLNSNQGPSVVADEVGDIAIVFHELADRWRAETVVLSDVTKKAMNRSYQQVIGLGPGVLPLILRELERDPDDWFWALSAITRENPIKPEHAGNMDLMARDWLDWGKEHGLA
jgi:hypothetical protein